MSNPFQVRSGVANTTVQLTGTGTSAGTADLSGGGFLNVISQVAGQPPANTGAGNVPGTRGGQRAGGERRTGEETQGTKGAGPSQFTAWSKDNWLDKYVRTGLLSQMRAYGMDTKAVESALNLMEANYQPQFDANGKEVPSTIGMFQKQTPNRRGVVEMPNSILAEISSYLLQLSSMVSSKRMSQQMIQSGVVPNLTVLADKVTKMNSILLNVSKMETYRSTLGSAQNDTITSSWESIYSSIPIINGSRIEPNPLKEFFESPDFRDLLADPSRQADVASLMSILDDIGTLADCNPVDRQSLSAKLDDLKNLLTNTFGLTI